MGWFESQIEERRSADQQLLEDSFVRVAGVVLGQRSAERNSDARIITKNAIDEILKAFHCKPIAPPESSRSHCFPTGFTGILISTQAPGGGSG